MRIAIDPGMNGGIAWEDNGGVRVCNMPETDLDLFVSLEYLRNYARRKGATIECWVEQVGGYFPGNSGPAAVTFARHMGHIDMALRALRIPEHRVLPNVWMRTLFGKALPKDKQKRKKYIKAEMQRRYPHLTVTLKNADALGILTYALKQTATTE